MQVVETEKVASLSPPRNRCTVCDHDSVNAINALLVSASQSNRRTAKQFGLTEAAVRRHRENHLAAKIKRIAEKEQAKGDSQFRESLQFLMAESRQYVLDAHGAVKMQKVTVKQPLIVNGMPAEVTAVDDDGNPIYDSAGDPVKTPVMVNAEEYREFRDIGAMAPAINAAKGVTELLGASTGELNANSPGAGVNVHLSVIMPRTAELPTAIDVTPQQVIEAAPVEGVSES